jgi:hypothetical protein
MFLESIPQRALSNTDLKSQIIFSDKNDVIFGTGVPDPRLIPSKS